MNYLIFGHEQSRRAREWRNVLGNVPVQWVSYEEVAQGNFPVIKEPTTVRITSPGGDFDTDKLLLSLGGYPKAEQLVFERGRIYPHQYWYQGWCKVLDQIHAFLQGQPACLVMNHPIPIQLAFDKVECQQLLTSRGIPIPKIYAEQLISFQHLLAIMEDKQVRRVFLKPAHGSSASGIMMFRKNGERLLLETTIGARQEKGELKLFNYKRLQKYHKRDIIEAIIEEMIPNRLHVEEWVIKKRFQAKSTDFRVVTINQQAVFIQPRHSHHPITNLRLGNEKGSLENLELEWGRGIIDHVRAVAEDTARHFPKLFYAGLDIAVDRKGNPYVLEVNPFGDFLKDIFVMGKNTYELELSHWQRYLVQHQEKTTAKHDQMGI